MHLRTKHLWSKPFGPILYIFLALICLFTGCKSYRSYKTTSIEKINTGPGPEDIALVQLNNKSYLVAACAQRRDKIGASSFYLINPNTKASSVINIINLPDTIHLDLHGIDIEKIENKTYLYAIDHHQTSRWQQIIRFEFVEEQLKFDTIFSAPKYLINPNDLDVDSKGNIYVSNSLGKGSIFWQYLLNQKKSSVVKYNAVDKKWEFIINKMSYANGVAITDSALFIATTRMHGLYSYSNMLLSNKTKITKGKQGRRVSKINGLDNLILANGLLYTTAHPAVFKFVGHAKNANKKSPSQIWTINLQTNTSTLIYQSDGTEINGASTALFLDGKIYISQIFEPYIIVIEP